MRTAKEKRAVKARCKMLQALADAQAFNQSIWSTVAYRHGTPADKFSNHGKYYFQHLNTEEDTNNE